MTQGKALASKSIRNWLPPKLIDLARSRFGNRFDGDYSSWEQARAACTGYEDNSIVERVTKSARAVRDGVAVYERDSVLCDEIEYSWPALANLMFVAAQSENELRVLDFGGALGTTYRQNLKYLSRLKRLSWAIVEQAVFVEVGKREFENDQLRFFDDVASAFQTTRPNVTLISGVLQYLPDPHALLEKLLGQGVDYLLFDRTPLLEAQADRLTVQRIPGHIYPASYPAWFFSRQRFIGQIETQYDLVERFDAADRANIPSRYTGFLFQRKGLASRP